ncbi:MAG: SpoIIE family protein phosphatase [Syntrophaceae bacterium]
MKQLKNVLIIDTAGTSPELPAEQIAKQGFPTTVAVSQAQGMAYLIEKKPDIVVLYLDSEGENSLTSLREILHASPNTKVIATCLHDDGLFSLECMRAGAIDYIKGPLTVDALLESFMRIRDREFSLSMSLEPDTECVVSEAKILIFGNDLESIPYIINQAVLNAGKVCPDIELLKMALGEIVLNAVEHGNLNITMEEKFHAVNDGVYRALLDERRSDARYASRVVILEVHMDRDTLVYHVTDEGDGFDYHREFDPDPQAHIGSGLGLEIARNFFSDICYTGRGNRVRLVYSRRGEDIEAGDYRDTTEHGDFLLKLTDSLASGLLMVSGEGRIILWNDAAEMISGIMKSDILGRYVHDAPDMIRNLLSEDDNRLTQKRQGKEPLHMEKTVTEIGSTGRSRFTIVLFSNVSDAVKQKEDLERLLLETAETKDLMEEQAAKLTIALAEMDELNEIIQTQNQKMVTELEMAGRLQKSLLPDTFENINGVSFSCKYIPSIHIGGDLYDVVDLGHGQTGFIIADVSGHGVAAALISSMFKMSFHALASTVASPKILMHLLNGEMKPVLNEDYITSFYVLTDRYARSITYSNAAHPTPFLFKRSSGRMLELDTDGFFLGSFDDGGYTEKTESNVEPGDALLLFTDCILETENESGEQYGKNRLIERFSQAIQCSRGQEVIDEIEADVRKFNARDTLDDDFTIMLLEFWEEPGTGDSLPLEGEDAIGGFVEF